MRRDGVGDADLLHHAHDLVVQRNRARQLVDPRLTFADQHAQPRLRQQGRRHRTGGAITDDGDVENRVGERLVDGGGRSVVDRR